MIIIIITAIIIYFVFIAWTWQSLGYIEKRKKVVFLLIGIILMYSITLFIFHTGESKVLINMENERNLTVEKMQKQIQNVLVIIFTGINGIILMPQIGKILNKINEDEIKKEQLIKRIILLIIIFIICAIFESGYMKDTIEGILKVYDTLK